MRATVHDSTIVLDYPCVVRKRGEDIEDLLRRFNRKVEKDQRLRRLRLEHFHGRRR